MKSGLRGFSSATGHLPSKCKALGGFSPQLRLGGCGLKKEGNIVLLGCCDLARDGGLMICSSDNKVAILSMKFLIAFKVGTVGFAYELG